MQQGKGGFIFDWHAAQRAVSEDSFWCMHFCVDDYSSKAFKYQSEIFLMHTAGHMHIPHRQQKQQHARVYPRLLALTWVYLPFESNVDVPVLNICQTIDTGTTRQYAETCMLCRSSCTLPHLAHTYVVSGGLTAGC